MYKYIHTCIYIHISCPHTYTYAYIHTRIQNVHMNARKARLKRRRGSDCAGSPSWHQETLPFSLSASRQRAVQTTSTYLHWCGADPPSSSSTPAPSLAMPAHGPPKRGHFSAILAGFSFLGATERHHKFRRRAPIIIESGSPNQVVFNWERGHGVCWPEGSRGGHGEGEWWGITATARISRYTNFSKINQYPVFVTYRRKERCMHPHNIEYRI